MRGGPPRSRRTQEGSACASLFFHFALRANFPVPSCGGCMCGWSSRRSTGSFRWHMLTDSVHFVQAPHRTGVDTLPVGHPQPPLPRDSITPRLGVRTARLPDSRFLSPQDREVWSGVILGRYFRCFRVEGAASTALRRTADCISRHAPQHELYLGPVPCGHR